ncbi:MAG: AAA family ATPase [Candidatus Buchananbacteria bacterium]|jgi:uncharacterized protein CbrC (UPF0167 family)
MANGQSGIPITPEQLAEFKILTLPYLKSVRWVSDKTPQKPDASGMALALSLTSPAGARNQDEVKILDLLRNISGNQEFLSENANQVVTAIHKGLTIGFFLSLSYIRSSGLEQLVEANKKGQLPDDKKGEFRDKQMTAAAIRIFCAAYYVVWQLEKFKTESVSNINIKYPGFSNGEFSLYDPGRATQCIMYYYGAFIRDSGKIATDLDLIQATLAYFTAVVEETNKINGSLNFTEPFTSINYMLQGEDFCINGFSADFSGHVQSSEFRKIDINSIVGNKVALHLARRMVLRSLCYKPDEKCNIMFDLNLMSTIRMGYGIPGTGKSMIIAAIATLLAERCEWLGIPFLFWPMPNNMVSSFQGKTAEQMDNWMASVFDPGKIIYAPIDDAENNLEERTRQGVSEGVRQLIGVFLRRTEGASAIWHGNSFIDIFTNIPDQVDAAVLSRVISRFPVEGATTIEDFMDQDYLWWKKLKEIDPTFVNLADPNDYEYMSAQAKLASLSDAYRDYREPKEPAIKEIIASLDKNQNRQTHRYFAVLDFEVKKVFPKFSSRDVRNIQKAVDERLGDFDFPADWMENPETFFRQPYDRQREMSLDLMKQNMKGLSFAEVRLQESMRYLDNMVAITEMGERREIERQAIAIRRQQKAIEMAANN